LRYLGCKTLLLDWIGKVVSDLGVSQGTFADLFTGTTTVAQHFKTKGFQLITSDTMYFSYAFQHTYIASSCLPKFEKVLTLPTVCEYTRTIKQTSDSIAVVVSYLNQLSGKESFIFENYSPEGNIHKRQYFTSYNARKVDAIREQIDLWRQANLLNDSEYFLLLTSLIEAVSDISNTAGTYGAFLKHVDDRALKPLNLMIPNVLEDSLGHKVFCEDANQVVKRIECDVLYVDPPYNRRQYAAYYHLLDTIAKWDKPNVKGKTGRRPYAEQRSRYSTVEAEQALTELVRDANCKHILISYNDEGRLSRETILKVLSLRGKPSLFENDIRRYSSQATGNNSEVSISSDVTTPPAKSKKVTELLFHVEINS
jgi:adenine-specific DNA-methyltransferase